MMRRLLWYDNNRKSSLAEKIEVAAKHYREKYGLAPNQIYVNAADAKKRPDQFAKARKELEARGGKLETKTTIMRNHIWLGMQRE